MIRLTRSEYKRLTNLASVSVRIDRDGLKLNAVELEFFGPLAVFPSTSNNRKIRYRQIRGKLHPFIGKSQDHIQRLNLAKAMYVAKMVESGLALPSFKDSLVHVQVLLANSRNIIDSHNHSKPIGDWLEEVSLIDNDKNAEIHCYKKADYSLTGVNPDTTTILIRRREHVQKILQQKICDISTAASRLWGEY